METQARNSDIVVLIPGLWMPAWVMLPLAWRLQGRGLPCIRFGYPSARSSLEENSDRLASELRTLGDRSVHLVGHSLGGVLALHATTSRRLARVRSIVMMGSPAGGSYVARCLLEQRLGRWMLGRTVPAWLEICRPEAPDGVALGVIAGTRALGLGMIVAPGMERPHDGVIRVAETKVAGAADYAEVDVSHAAILTSTRVARLVAAFVRNGRFRDALHGLDETEQSPAMAAAASKKGGAG